MAGVPRREVPEEEVPAVVPRVEEVRPAKGTSCSQKKNPTESSKLATVKIMSLCECSQFFIPTHSHTVHIDMSLCSIYLFVRNSLVSVTNVKVE